MTHVTGDILTPGYRPPATVVACTRCGERGPAQLMWRVPSGYRWRYRCPPCHARWLEVEEQAAIQLERHPGRPRQRNETARI